MNASLSRRLGPGVHGKAVLLFLLAAMVAGASILLSLEIPAVARFGYLGASVRVAITLASLVVLWLALKRAALEPGRRIAVWLTAAALYTAWLAAVWAAALEGAVGPNPIKALGGQAAIFVPLLIGLPVLLASKKVGEVLAGTPRAWLVGLQVYRVFGSSFIVAGLAGQLPLNRAIPIGLGDVLVGLLALPLAVYLQAQGRNARGFAIAWNVFGILDFVDALTLTALAGAAAAPPLNQAVSIYPAIMAAVFSVPSSTLLHALSLRQLLSRQGLPGHATRTKSKWNSPAILQAP